MKKTNSRDFTTGTNAFDSQRSIILFAIIFFSIIALSLLIALPVDARQTNDRYQSRDGHPAEHLPPYIKQVSSFGERPEWSHDGKKILFVEKPMGEVYELELKTGMIRPITRHFRHYGFTRANYLVNGDILLSGPIKLFDVADQESRNQARHQCWLSVLTPNASSKPIPLDTMAAEGPAVSRKQMRIAWTHRDKQDPKLGKNHAKHFVADIVYENGNPRLSNQRTVFDSHQLPFRLGNASLETQDFVGEGDRRLIFSVYQIKDGNNTDTYEVDLVTGKFRNLTRSPEYYDEPEGVFPDGLHTCVEHAPNKHSAWPLSDIYKLKLDGSGEMQRLTYFSEFKGFKGTQGVVSDDGSKLCFQIGKSGDEAGVGYGFFVMDLKAAGKHFEPFRSYANEQAIDLKDNSLAKSVTKGNSVWVAVGYGGRRMISQNGVRWKITGEWAQPGKDDSNNLMSLVYAKNRFVAVGGGGGGKTGGGHVLVSKDGVSWRETWKAPGRINPVVFGNDLFIAGGPRRQIYWSKNAETWTKGAELDDRRCTHFRKGVFGNGIFVITGNHGGNSPAWICTSKDGKSIQDLTFDIPNIRGLAFGKGRFVVVGNGVRITSVDGSKWKSTGLPDNEPLNWVIHTGNEFVCGGGKKCYRSSDGVRWTVDSRRFRGTPKWTDGTHYISTSWPGKMYSSTDAGKSWKPGNQLTANGINAVVKGSVAQDIELNTVERNCVFQWSANSKVNYSDPFQVQLDVVIKNKKGQTTRLPAFWAGKKEWRFRFSSNELGQFTFKTECSNTNDEGLHGKTGKIHVTEYSGKNRLFKNGPIQISEDKKHFEHRDGKPFFWLADSWWHGMTTRLPWPHGFKELTRERKDNGFSVIQFAIAFPCDIKPFDPRGANEAGHAWTKDFGSINPGYFDLVDQRVEWLADQELVPNIVGMWGYYLPFMGVEKAKQHWRYLIARYGAYPVSWTVCGESTLTWYLLDGPEESHAKQQQKKGWSDVATYIARIDPYRRIRTVHPGPSSGRFEPISNMNSLDVIMLQPGHQDSSVATAITHRSEALRRFPGKPIMIGEACFEGMNGECKEKVQRMIFWGSVLSGAPGHCYGADAIWQLNTRSRPFGKSPSGHIWGITPWEIAYKWPGAKHVGIGRRILSDYSWHEFTSLPSSIDPPASADNPRNAFAAGIKDQVRLIYLPSGVPPWNRKFVAKELQPNASYIATYIDPLTGQKYKPTEFNADSKGEWRLPAAPILQDWVLVIERGAK